MYWTFTIYFLVYKKILKKNLHGLLHMKFKIGKNYHKTGLDQFQDCSTGLLWLEKKIAADTLFGVKPS